MIGDHTYEVLELQNRGLYLRFAVVAPDDAETPIRVAQSSGFRPLLFSLPRTLFCSN